MPEHDKYYLLHNAILNGNVLIRSWKRNLEVFQKGSIELFEGYVVISISIMSGNSFVDITCTKKVKDNDVLIDGNIIVSSINEIIESLLEDRKNNL